MAEPKGFMKVDRRLPPRRPVDVRITDWHEVYPEATSTAGEEAGYGTEAVKEQARRCMDCGIPFCHHGCPLGNLIPEWNDLVRTGRWELASDRLHATNNFPEFTGRLCPAPCEAACVLAIPSEAVAIKQIEVSIIDRAFADGRVVPQPPEAPTGFSVAVIGSGPAGLAAAQQLTRAGHAVTVFERAERLGGLLRYGIPEFKMEKRHLDRRLEQMRDEGTQFRAGVEVGRDVTVARLREEFDAVVLAIGSTVPRMLQTDGSDLAGIHAAMDYLVPANQSVEGSLEATPIDAGGKHVVIIGGGDTGADCLGTVHRQGAASVHQLEILPQPPDARTEAMPWPTYPMLLRESAAHEEGGERLYAVNTESYLGDANGHVRGLRLVDVRRGEKGFEPVAGTERELPADLVLLAMGFVGVEGADGWLAELGVEVDSAGRIVREEDFAAAEGVYVAGDAGRGQSLIVWAIAEGRSAAAAADAHLSGHTNLPSAIGPQTRALTA